MIFSRQTSVCRDKTRLLKQQNYACHATSFVATRVQTDMLHVVTHNCGAICFEAGLVSFMSRQNWSFGATKRVFWRNKTSLVTYACRDNIIGGSCHKNYFCATNTRLSRQNVMLRQNYVCHKIFLSRQNVRHNFVTTKHVFWSNKSIIAFGGAATFVATKLCHDKITFVVTFVATNTCLSRQKIVCVFRDKNYTCASSRQWYKNMHVTW